MQVTDQLSASWLVVGRCGLEGSWLSLLSVPTCVALERLRGTALLSPSLGLESATGEWDAFLNVVHGKPDTCESESRPQLCDLQRVAEPLGAPVFSCGR